jgi:hypothetical protein
MSTKQRIVGISFPSLILEELDRARQDVPRSKYIVRLLEKKFKFWKGESKMNSEKFGADKIIQKAENIIDVLPRHLGEEGGCDHKINVIVEEAFGPSLEAKDQYEKRSIPVTKGEVTTWRYSTNKIIKIS